MKFVSTLASLISASRMSALAALMLLCPSLMSVAHAQSNGGVLQPGKTIEREMTTDDVHSFEVNLDENQLLEMVVEQRGLDVVVKVFAPDGKVLAAFDTPNGTQGPEAVSIVAAASGKHRIELLPFGQQDGGASAGRYEARIVAIREATKDELEKSKSLASLQPKALELLDTVVAQTQTLKLGTNRSMLLAQAADLLWEHDERRARALFAEAMKTLQDESKAAFAAVREVVESDMEADGGRMIYGESDPIAGFRQQTLQLAARHDAQLALDLARDYGDAAAGGDVAGSVHDGGNNSRMELALALSVVGGNPAKAVELAEKSLSNGVSPQVVNLLSRFKPKDNEHASKLANAIAKKLSSSDFNTDGQARQMAMNILRLASDKDGNLNNSMNGMMGNMGSNRTANTTAQKTPALFSDQSLQSLAESLATTALNAKTAKTLLVEMQGLMPAIEKYAPSRAPLLRRQSAEVTRKMTELQELMGYNSGMEGKYAEMNQLAQSGTVDEVLTAAPKVAPELQPMLYAQAAQRAIQQGDVDGARRILKKITDAGIRNRMMMEIERQTIEQALKDGKTEIVRNLLPSLRTDNERANMLSRLAIKLAGEGKKEQAKQLLAEARELIGGHAANTARLNTQLWVARSYLEIEPSKSYDMAETAIDRLNELTAAAATLDGFLQQGTSFKEGEVTLGEGAIVSSLFEPYTTLLNSLARFNFDRARSVVERIQRPEMRVMGYMLLAQGVLRPQGETPPENYGY